MSVKRRRCDHSTLTIGSHSILPSIVEKEGQTIPITNDKCPENEKKSFNIDPGGLFPNMEQYPLPKIPGLNLAINAFWAEKYLSSEHFHKTVSFT